MRRPRFFSVLELALVSALVAVAAGPMACAQGLEFQGSGGAGGDGGSSTITTTGPGGTTTTTATTGPGAGPSSSSSVTSSSSGQMGGVCDNTGDCGTCADCSSLPGGACSSQYNSCANSIDCLDYVDCIYYCAPNDPYCYDDCELYYPTGAQLYYNYAVCVVCGECFGDCDGATAGCP